MAWEVPSLDVALPSANLLQSAYESVRPHLRPEDVPAALTRDLGPGICISSAERTSLLLSGNATSDPCTTSYSPCSKMDERSTLTSFAWGPGKHDGDSDLPLRRAPSQSSGKELEQQKHDTTKKKKQSRVGGALRTTGAAVEHRHERVIQHRDRSTTYTLGGPRCSRTDGKHWQCKREALPDQKYCEKHLHRGLLRSRKRKRGDDFQDLEGERLFQGWQRAKPKLWPGLCQSPPQMDQSTVSSLNGLPSQAPFSIPSLQVPPSADSPWPAAGPQVTLGQWTPAQERILKATLSELGLDQNNTLCGSSSIVADLRAQSRHLKVEGSPWADSQYEPTGPPRPLLPLPRAPNVLRVGQDQAVLPACAHIVLGGDGGFTVAIPTAILASVGVGVNADGLISTWGCGVPIHIAFGETAEVVKLEAVKRDGGAVVFKGCAQASLELGGGQTSSVPAEGPGRRSPAPRSRGAFIPWDGAVLAEDPAGEKAEKGLDLDLNLHVSVAGTAVQQDPPLWKGPGLSALEALPCSPLTKGGSLGCGAQESWSHSVQTPDAWREDRPPSADAAPGLSHWLRSGLAPERMGPGAGLRRTTSLSADRFDGAGLQRTASLPVGSELNSTPSELTQILPEKALGIPGVSSLGSLALGELSLGQALVGNVASVILQTPRGVFLRGGVKLDEAETEGSCDGSLATREKPRAVSDGQGSQCGMGGDSMDSASSLPKNRKRARDGGSQLVDLTLALPEPGQGRQKGRCIESGERGLSTSLSLSRLDGPSVCDLRVSGNGTGVGDSGPEECRLWHGTEKRLVPFFPDAARAQDSTKCEKDGRPGIGTWQDVAGRLTGGLDPRAGLRVLTGPHARAHSLPVAGGSFERPFPVWRGEEARALFEAARGSELTAEDLIRPIKSISRAGRSGGGGPAWDSRVL